jgi:hypothetical protein
MSALDNALEDNIIERYDGRPDYLACCGKDVDGEVKHEPFCSMQKARAELAELRENLASYKQDMEAIVFVLKDIEFCANSIGHKAIE